MIGEFNVSPSEYWGMSPTEVALILESKRPKHVGGIHEDDLADMLERRQQLIDEGVKVL